MNWIFAGDVPQLATFMIISGKATVLLALVVIIRAFMRQASASARYFLTNSTLVVAATLPLLALLVPDSKLPVPMIIHSHVTSGLVSTPPSMIHTGEPKLETPDNTVKGSEARSSAAFNQPENIMLYLWLLGTSVAAGRVLIGSIWCARNRRHARRLGSERVLALVLRAANRIGLRERPHVMVSSAIAAPYIYGIIKPVLILPYNVMRWPEDRLMSVLQHEFAHIKRKDHITWPLTNLAASWLWFVPILWTVLAQMKQDKERACDDYVLAGGHSKVSYAQHLLEVCASVRTTVGPVPISSLLSGKNEVKERITYMLRPGINHRPISPTRRFAFVTLLMAIAIPLISIAGFSAPAALQDVTAQERDAAMTTLASLYAELSDGADYQSTRERFLTSDYFDDPRLTLENLDVAVQRPAFDNTLHLISEAGVGLAREVNCQVRSISRDGDELVVTQQVDIIADRADGTVRYRDADGGLIRTRRTVNPSEAAVKDCHLVKALVQQIRLRKEGGFWKISRFDDGVALMRMDTDNPYGPIFLIWMEDIDEETTPFGAGVFKVFPRDLIPDARNTTFVLEIN